MKDCVYKMTSKGASLIETLIGTSIAMGMLAATLHVGTELQRKSSWEEEALTLHTIGTQIMQTLEEHFLNAGHGFGSTLLLAQWNNYYEHLPGDHANEHRYAVDIYPCWKDCQNEQNYGPYKNLHPENFSDEIHTHAMDPSYIRGIVGKFEDKDSNVSTKWTYILEDRFAGFEWRGGGDWLYAVVDKDSAWGCALGVTYVGKKDNQDVFRTGISGINISQECHSAGGSFWEKENYTNLRAGPLNGFSARLKFDVLGPALEFPKDNIMTTLARHNSGHVGSHWGYPYYLDWTIASRSVISLKAALGIVDPQNPHQVLWFPDKEKNHPYISMCDETVDPESFARCADIVSNYFGGRDEELELNYRHALMRRVRAVRLSLIVQSRRADARKVELDGSGAFVANADGTFKNGRLTKRFERTIWPPNLQEMKADMGEESE